MLPKLPWPSKGNNIKLVSISVLETWSHGQKLNHHNERTRSSVIHQCNPQKESTCMWQCYLNFLKCSWTEKEEKYNHWRKLHKPGFWAYGQLLVLLVIRAMQHSADLLMHKDEFKPIIININTGILKPDSFMKHQQLNKKLNLLHNCLYRLRLVWIMVLSIFRLVCDNKDFSTKILIQECLG